MADIESMLPDGSVDPGIVVADDSGSAAIESFMAAMAKHRHPERETDPPRI